MKPCEQCGLPFEPHRRKKRFCGKPCALRFTFEHRKVSIAGWNKQERIKVSCLFCGKKLERLARTATGNIFCSILCHNRHLAVGRDTTGTKNANWKGGIQIYRRFKKDACERCQSIKHLIVHHRDRDRYNNVIENLETLCRSCHATEHDITKHFKRVRVQL
jgi:hypothetical protein